jgi:MscS family membrane protein
MFAAWLWQSFQLGNNSLIEHLGLAFLIFIGFYLLKKIFTKYIFNVILRVCKKANIGLYSRIAVAFKKPVEVLFLILGIYAALTYLAIEPSRDALLLGLLRSAVIILAASGLYDLVDEKLLLSDEFQEKLNLDAILVHFFSKIVRFIIIALAICIVAQEWDYDISSLIAGLGLGGLAFALAAKDTLANFFGGMVIIMDKPFSLGDWITTPSVEGAVENISFRSTRIRTAAQALVTVPNSTLANEPVTNLSQIGKRKVNFTLKIAGSTSPDQLQNCITKIRTILEEHPGIHNEATVYFDKVSEVSLDILIDYYTVSTVLAEHQQVKEEINFKIMKVLEKEGVQVAFPGNKYFGQPGG